MDNILRDCGCLCINPENVHVVSAVEAGTVLTLTINRELTDLSFFKLFVPCSIISSFAATDTVEITDGTNTYPANSWLGNLLRVSTLKKVFCNGCFCNCNVCLVCFVGNDPVHVQVLNRIV